MSTVESHAHEALARERVARLHAEAVRTRTARALRARRRAEVAARRAERLAEAAERAERALAPA